MSRFRGRKRRYLGRGNDGVRAGGGVTNKDNIGDGAALYFDTPPGWINDKRPVRVSMLNGTQTAFTPEEARQWLDDCRAWLDASYPVTEPCDCCNGSGLIVCGEDG